MIAFSPTISPDRPGNPQPRGVLNPTGDGGYAFVATARTTAIDEPDGEYPRIREPAQDFLAMAIIELDGTIDLRRTMLPIPDGQEAPDEARLEAMAVELGRDRLWPETPNGQPATWTRVRLTDEITDFVERGLVGSRSAPFTLVDTLARRLSKVINDLRLADGSLYQRLSRHHFDIPDYMARLSGSLAWAKPIVDTHPWIPQIWLTSWANKEKSPAPTANDLELIVEHHMGEADFAAELRWCDRFFAAHPAPAPELAIFRLLSFLPQSWWPTELDDYVALHTITNTLLDLCNWNPETTLDMLRPAKGRFAAYIDKVGRENPWEGHTRHPGVSRNYLAAENAISDCDDLVRDVDSSLVSPMTGRAAYEGWQTALKVISNGGGLRRYLDASRAWHDIPRQEGRFTTSQHVWPPCVDRFTYGDLVVTELCSAIELWDEGVAMQHCVGGDNYVMSCMQGTSRILSVRQDDRPLSTVEIDRGYRVIQHRGHDNFAPPPNAEEAVAAWGQAIRYHTLPTSLMLPVAMPQVEPVAMPGYGPSAWRRFIRRDLASMSWEEFGETVRAMEAETAPDDDPPGMAP